MRIKSPRQSGFTLIELMITVAIVGILAAIAIPGYQEYLRRTRFSEIALSAATWKIAVAECVHDLNGTAGCDAGTNGIPNGISSASGLINTLTVVNGTITITPVAQNGFVATDTLILNPTIGTSNRIRWSATGGAVTKGYMKTQ